MKISEAYMALGSLLPSSRPSKVKKRWTAPRIIDKVLEYIPELENEIEELTLKKKNTQSAVESIMPSSVLVDKKISSSAMASEINKSITVSVNEVKKGQLIFQICRQRNEQKDFSSLLEFIEEEVAICLVSASTLHVCDERDCCHIHIQIINESSSASNGNDSSSVLKEKIINESSSASNGNDSSSVLKEKVISWLS
ncbi:transcription factor bHLH160 isoform X2 [Humulus lupulus]|nr:transcription factor bHLH160 isoform X2 [Humulus lupulus]